MGRRAEARIHPEKENSELTNLWRQFNFMGEPPEPGSVAENRLREKCLSYTSFVLNEGKSGATGSDSYRRQLHNEIAIMVSGTQRSEMDFADADPIAEFAIKFATGMTREKAIEAFNQ